MISIVPASLILVAGMCDRFAICVPLPSTLLVVLEAPTEKNPFSPWICHS